MLFFCQRLRPGLRVAEVGQSLNIAATQQLLLVRLAFVIAERQPRGGMEMPLTRQAPEHGIIIADNAPSRRTALDGTGHSKEPGRSFLCAIVLPTNFESTSRGGVSEHAEPSIQPYAST